MLFGLGLLLPHCASFDRAAADGPPALQALSAAACRATLVDDAAHASLRHAAERSLEYYRHLSEDHQLHILGRPYTVRELRSVIEALFTHSLDAGGLAELCDHFSLVRVRPSQPLLITGYYEPVLDARRHRTDRFRYPLYAVPSDLAKADLGAFCPACARRIVVGRLQDGQFVPYYTRAEIDAGAIAGRALEFAWLDDPVEAFFLHIQGSALLRFDDGAHLHVSYDGSNGRAYTSIGRVLVEAGKLAADDVSLESLKSYLRAHPEECEAILQRNERYVFFRTVPVGPVGSLNVPLTAGRSIAADKRSYAPGALALLKIVRLEEKSGGSPISRLVFIQDAGAAISGDHRLDVYWGSGEAAAAIAGGMSASGELFFLVPEKRP